MDKHWAHKHILDPLTGPQPSQETGPGSSHLDPRRLATTSSSFLKLAESPLPTKSPPPTPLPPYTLRAFGSSWDEDNVVLHNHPTSSPVVPDFSPRCPHHDASYRAYAPPCSEPFWDVSDLAPPPYHKYFDHDDARTPFTMSSYDASPASLLPGGRDVDYTAVTSSPAGSHARRPRSLSPTLCDFIASSSSSHPSSLPRSRLSVDMSDRPLDKIRAEARAADRRNKQRKRATWTDSIDRLDTIGGSYHHGGPYDAALPYRNRNKKYSPLAAVEESNMEAIRATPRENLIDSLSQHVPLQGTASVAPGALDLSGNVMDYTEGSDLMREDDAPGGAYKRWSGIPYHPDDLKGKGEPSFTLERLLKSKKHHKHASMPASAFEMLPGINTRQRPASVTPDSLTVRHVLASGHLQRSRSTGKRLSNGIKGRLGSFRRKKAVPAGEAC